MTDPALCVDVSPSRRRKKDPPANLDGLCFTIVVNDRPFVVGISGEDIENGNALWIDTSGPEPMVSTRPVFTKPEEVPDLVALIRQAEWSSYDGCDDPACPWCRQSEDLGHLPTCPVAPILYPKERA